MIEYCIVQDKPGKHKNRAWLQTDKPEQFPFMREILFSFVADNCVEEFNCEYGTGAITDGVWKRAIDFEMSPPFLRDTLGIRLKNIIGHDPEDLIIKRS